VIALAAVALGLGNQAIAASVAAFLSIAANALRLAATDDADGSDHIQNLSVVTWTLIILAMFGSVYVATPDQNNGLFAAFAVASIAYLSHKMVIPSWAKQLLHSPATLAFLAIIGAATVGIISALQWIMVFQLSVLIIANKKRDAEGKKSNEV
jgi:phosphatidylserine synthase